MSEAGDVLAQLRAKFLDRCRGDADALDAVLAEGDLQGEAARGLVHRLSGAAGTFGYPEISEIAGGIDDAFHDGQPVSADDLRRLAKALRAILSSAF